MVVLFPACLTRNGPDSAPQVAAVLDDWHHAAAMADEARYFRHFAANGVFMGTIPARGAASTPPRRSAIFGKCWRRATSRSGPTPWPHSPLCSVKIPRPASAGRLQPGCPEGLALARRGRCVGQFVAGDVVVLNLSLPESVRVACRLRPAARPSC
jgi:hypothetical protein